MDESGSFDRLAQELSLAERKSLLDKLEGLSLISEEPLYRDAPREDSGDIEARYARLPWYRRLLYFILGFFRNTAPVKVFQNSEIVKLEKSLEQSAPALYRAAGGLLLPEFYESVVRLRDSSRFFYNALDAGFNRDKGGFFVFLGSLEMPDIHARLVEETSPQRIGELHPELAESLLRQTAQNTLEDILGMISEEQRALMYADTRSLICLKQLSSFLYDRLLLAFRNDEASGGMICQARIIREPLMNLNNILCSLKAIPSLALLGSLFVFILQDRSGEDFDHDAETRGLLKQAAAALAAIRTFNRQTPLTLIVRAAARDVSLSPQAMTGGEDWFMMYRDRWRKDVDDRVFLFFSERRRRELRQTYRDFFSDTPPLSLENAASPDHPEGIAVQGADSLGFLLTFANTVFPRELDPLLQTLSAHGEFLQPDNRLEYDEACRGMMSLDAEIRKFDEALGPGDWGKRREQINGELTSLPVKRRKMQILTEECGGAAREIIDRAAWGISVLANVTGAISAGAPSVHYAGLSNLEKLEEKSPGFREGLRRAAGKLGRARDMLGEVGLLESDGS